MNFFVILKAGFLGFALSVGVEMLVFYLAGTFLRQPARNFIRLFCLAGVASFVAVYVLLHLQIRSLQSVDADTALFLSGCIGGWFGGIVAGLTNLRGLLLDFLK